MAKYRITAPDGATYEVEGNGTEQEALAHFQSQYAQAKQQPYKLELGNVPDSGGAAAYSLSGRGREAGAIEQLAGGAKHAWDRAAYGLEGLVRAGANKVLPDGWVDPEIAPEHRQQLQQGRAFVQGTGPLSTVGEIAGDIVTTGGAYGRGIQAANKVARALPRALGTATRVAAPAVVGAGVGLATQPEDRTTGAVVGALGGVAGQALQRVTGGLLKPLVSEDAQALMQRGVQPTVGQSMDRSLLGRMIRSTEDKVASTVPVVGDMIQGARRRSLNEFSDATIREAGLPATFVKELPSDPALALETVRDRIGSVYDVALTNQQVRGSDTVLQHARDIVNDPDLFLGRDQKTKVLAYVKKRVLDRVDEYGELPAEAAKQIDSDLGRAAQKFLSGATADDRNMGQALREVQTKWRDILADSVGDENAAMLRAANAAYGKLLRAERAAGYLGGEPSVITPAKLMRATSTMAPPKPTGGRALPRATDPMRKMATEGLSTLSSTVPDSGTAGRLLLPGGVAALTMGVDPLGAATAATVAGAAYSRLGSQVLTQGLQSFAPQRAHQIAQRIIADAKARGVPEEVILSQGQNFIRSLIDHYSNQGANDATVAEAHR